MHIHFADQILKWHGAIYIAYEYHSLVNVTIHSSIAFVDIIRLLETNESFLSFVRYTSII